jgi:hypothetical protein
MCAAVLLANISASNTALGKGASLPRKQAHMITQRLY